VLRQEVMYSCPSKPQPGEMLACGNCGREILYDAMLDVAKEEATALAGDMLSDMLKKA
jgi:hypothetical protein